MPVTATPIFSQALRAAVLAFSTANTNRDGSGTVPALFTAGANGSIIDHIDINCIGTPGAGVIRLYIHNGTGAFLWKEILVTSTTPSTTVAVWSYSVDCSQRANNLFLPATWSLRISTHTADAFNALAFGSDL